MFLELDSVDPNKVDLPLVRLGDRFDRFEEGFKTFIVWFGKDVSDWKTLICV